MSFSVDLNGNTDQQNYFKIDFNQQHRLTLPLPLLNSKLSEIWHSTPAWQALPASLAPEAHFILSNEECLCVALPLAGDNAESLYAATFIAYQQLFALQKSAGYPHLIRIWQYFDDITAPSTATSPSLDRYMLFCNARAAAIAAAGLNLEQMPAATAIGVPANSTNQGGILYALLSKNAGLHLENPQQTNPYHYPKQYGPSSPNFARATYWNNLLLVSGTASILGHRSEHNDDISAQTQLILQHLDTLRQHPALPYTFTAEQGFLKIYLRNRRMQEEVSQHIATSNYAHTPLVYLLGDVCRPDLALEIEAIFTPIHNTD